MLCGGKWSKVEFITTVGLERRGGRRCFSVPFHPSLMTKVE